MTRENTPRSNESQEISYAAEIFERFKGVPPELLCNVEEIKRALNISDEPWAAVMRAGLPVLFTAGRAGIAWTTEIIEWARKKPKLPVMASTLRKKRQQRRKAK